jgi:cation diffusion facilitator CzcD-associated flavoprotein CzcO
MTDTIRTDLLIVGAGPFGLAIAAAAADAGIGHVVAGEPMSFWRDHMPAGMLLRSDTDWHLDPAGKATIEAFLEATGRTPEAVRPISRDLYLEYCGWFQEQKGISPRPQRISRIEQDEASSRFIADAGDSTYDAANVVLAVGFEYFKNVPPELQESVPDGRLGHTCDLVDFARFRGREVVIVGGRQSAFESAALIAEAGAGRVHIVYRHGTPAFETSDWSWVTPLMERFLDDPSWYRRLDAEEKAELNRRFWAEGRLRLEPWLAPRIERDNVFLHPSAAVASAGEVNGRLRLQLDNAEELEGDDVLLATGYRVDVTKLPFLRAGGLLDRFEVAEGFPVLNERLESSVPGLYFTSMAATRDFGSFFGFTVSARVAARIVANAVAKRLKL